MKKAAMDAPTLVIRGGRLVLPNRVIEDGMVVAQRGRIIHAGQPKSRLPKESSMVDAKGSFIAPGFVDIHVHGGAGADFMDGTPEAVRTAARSHAKHGTTTLLPTTTTGSPARIETMIRATALVMKNWTPRDGARPAGVHLYGPFFAADKIGAHPKDGRRDPTLAEFARYFSSGIIRSATCAAELPGAEAFYKAAKKYHCLITCGHSNSSWQEMARAFKAGMRHVDHFWCAMSSVTSLRPRLGTPMQASMEQFVLANEEMSTEVIADGFHLSDELLAFAHHMKGAKRLCLVTDSSRALDMPKGIYLVGHQDDGAPFLFDGEVGRMPDGTGLASSAVGMDHTVRTMLKATRAPLHEVIRMASLTPAERAGISHDCGSLEKGKRADVLVLDGKLRVKRIFMGSEEFH
jgi:N-acetylglucosamine-6-phosphate deacetylase